jgi:hypothetical protein
MKGYHWAFKNWSYFEHGRHGAPARRRDLPLPGESNCQSGGCKEGQSKFVYSMPHPSASLGYALASIAIATFHFLAAALRE